MGKVECPECRGTGIVMVRDTGVCCTEEYGTCRKCHGVGRAEPDPGVQIAELEAKVRRLEARARGSEDRWDR